MIRMKKRNKRVTVWFIPIWDVFYIFPSIRVSTYIKPTVAFINKYQMDKYSPFRVDLAWLFWTVTIAVWKKV